MRNFDSPLHKEVKNFRSRQGAVSSLGIVLNFLLGGLLLFLPASPETSGILGIVFLLALLSIGAPVGVAMGVVGAVGIWSLQGQVGVYSALMLIPYQAVASWPLSVLPMFVLMGLFLWRSGATDDVYRGAEQWLSWLPGGLAVTTNSAGAVLGAASGSTLGIAYALGRIGLPAMLSAGYPKRLSLAAVMMAGSGGQLIPPSILLVVYAGVASTPVGRQLLAGLVPGFLLISLYSLVLIVEALVHRRSPDSPTISPTVTSWKGRIESIRSGWPLPTIIIIVVGGIYLGVFTATEAGAFGAASALGLLIWYKRSHAFHFASKAAIEAVSSVGAIFLLLMGATVFSRFLALSRLTTGLAQFVSELDLNRVQFLLVLVVFYWVLGSFMEPVSMMLLTVPLLLPVLPVMDIDIIWFGVFITLMGEIAIISPPVGLLLFVVHGLAQEDDVRIGHVITFGDVYKAVLLFIPPAILMLVILILFPDAMIALGEHVTG